MDKFVEVFIFPLYNFSEEEVEEIDVDEYLMDRGIDIYQAFDNFIYDPLLFRALFLRLVSEQKQLFSKISEACGKSKFSNLESIVPCKISIDQIRTVCDGESALRYHATKDVVMRDKEFTNFEYPINVVLLLYKGIYYGHVYSWDLVSHIKSNDDMTEELKEFNSQRFTFMLGIRSRFDAPFLKLCNFVVKNVAYFLIEAIRLHAINVDSSAIIVPDPLGPMPRILEKLGFIDVEKYYKYNLEEKTQYFIHYLSQYTPLFGKYYPDCHRCFYSTNLLTPVIKGLEVFDYSV